MKYLINLYKKEGAAPFVDRMRRTYRRDTKLLAISRVKKGESIRQVSLDLGLIDPHILSDWLAYYDKHGEAAVHDTHARKNYLSKDEKYKKIIDEDLVEENIRLKAEIDYLKKSRSLAQKLEGTVSKTKSEIITELRKKYPLKVLLDVVGMSRSVYYFNVQSIANSVNKYLELEKSIEWLFLAKHRKKAGYHRIYIELKRMGYKVGNNKVLEIMQKRGFSKLKKKKWKYNSYEGDLGGVLPNTMNQNFMTMKPYEKAGTDVTMFSMEEEAVYLSPIIDFHTREVLSYSVGLDTQWDKIKGMLYQLKKEHGRKIKGMIIQSDQGTQYQSSRYRELLKKFGVVQSMSRKGNCLDNSPTENFFGRMKEEMWNGHEHEYKTPEDLIKAIHEHIQYHNNDRIVMRLKMSPTEYKKTVIKTLNM